MNNSEGLPRTIERLKQLEARIYAADGHEGHKYDAQFQDALREAWPLIREAIEAAAYIDKGMRGQVSTTEAEWLAGRKRLKQALSSLQE